MPREPLPDCRSVAPVFAEGPVLGDNVRLGVDIVLFVRLRALGVRVDLLVLIELGARRISVVLRDYG